MAAAGSRRRGPQQAEQELVEEGVVGGVLAAERLKADAAQLSAAKPGKAAAGRS
jgi:hypothetical protein